MNLELVKRITLKAADLETEPVTDEEINSLIQKLNETKQHKNQTKEVDYSSLPKDKLVNILKSREKEFKKIETYYRTQVDELEAELCDSRETLLELIEEKSTIEQELSDLRTQKNTLKNQVQKLECENSDSALYVQSLEHELELSARQNQRLNQNLEEEQQKIGILNKQIKTLQDSIASEKTYSERTCNELANAKHEIELLKNTIDELEDEAFELRKNQEGFECLTEDSVKEAIQQLSLIILSDNKNFALNPASKLLVKQIFGENATKAIKHYESQIETLSKSNQELKQQIKKQTITAELWLKELNRTSDWVQSLLDLPDLNSLETTVESKLQELKSKKRESKEAIKHTEPKEPKPSAGPETVNKLYSAKYSDFIHLLQVQAAAVEELLNEQIENA